jgi:hypothetical protein
MSRVALQQDSEMDKTPLSREQRRARALLMLNQSVTIDP